MTGTIGRWQISNPALSPLLRNCLQRQRRLRLHVAPGAAGTNRRRAGDLHLRGRRGRRPVPGRTDQRGAPRVRVRLLVDAYGSDTLPQGYFAPLLAAGGELRWFNPKRLLRINFRNHRKLLRADGEAVVGGLNIADAYDGDGLTSGWRDFAVRVDGPVVDALAESFARMWDLSVFGRREFRDFWRKGRRLAVGTRGQPELLLSGPGCPTAELRRRLLFDIRASRRMLAWAAYFLPSRRIGAAIRDAARRGEAEIMLGERSDVPVSRWASERLFTRFPAGRSQDPLLPAADRPRESVWYSTTWCTWVRATSTCAACSSTTSCCCGYRPLHSQPGCVTNSKATASMPTTLELVRWRRGRRWWQALRSYLAYQLLARLDPYVAARSLRSLS